MRNMNKSVIVMILLVCFSVSVYSVNESQQAKDTDARLKKLEDYRDINDKKFENKAKEIDLRMSEYKQEKNLIELIAIATGGLTILGMFGLWLNVKKIALKKIEEKFETLITDKRDQLIEIFNRHDKEAKLKEEKIIYVLTGANSEPKFLLEFFKKLGFKHTKLKKVTEYVKIEKKEKYDILFLYREENNDPLSDELCMQYINNSRDDSIIFVFGGKHLDSSLVKNRISSATFWSQIYGNIMSALMYQDYID